MWTHTQNITATQLLLCFDLSGQSQNPALINDGPDKTWLVSWVTKQPHHSGLVSLPDSWQLLMAHDPHMYSIGSQVTLSSTGLVVWFLAPLHHTFLGKILNPRSPPHPPSPPVCHTKLHNHPQCLNLPLNYTVTWWDFSSSPGSRVGVFTEAGTGWLEMIWIC